MKLSFAFLMVLPVALFAGCSHTNLSHPIVLDRVGPPAVKGADGTGSLLVFSASSVDMPDNTLATRRIHYSDYKIFSDDGQLLRTVHNDYDNDWEGPREVALAPGKYRIVAQAAKYGTVTVPVLIAAHQVTRVTLTGAHLDPERNVAGGANLVRLPDGQIVGYVAPENVPHRTLEQSPIAKDMR